MRNQSLTGYVLHQKPYGESRSLIYFFSQEHGLVHGIGKKNLPLFTPIQLFATGKNSLKTFSQSQVIHFQQGLVGQGLFAGMYLSEILLKLLPVEEPLPELWLAYQYSIEKITPLFQSNTNVQSKESVQPHFRHDLTLLKWQLRHFETLLFEQLGYGLDFTADALGQSIIVHQNYRYQLQHGFVPMLALDKADFVLTGEQLSLWENCLQDADFFDKIIRQDPENSKILLNHIGGIYRNVLDNLLNYQQLQSRELWRQFMQFQ